jgi:O-acetylhomoserine/O-acetylserine sulfhydrylase-like pyridoxal-dependent enzyme
MDQDADSMRLRRLINETNPALEARIAALEARIAALEAPNWGAAHPADAPALTVTSQNGDD